MVEFVFGEQRNFYYLCFVGVEADKINKY